MVFNATYNTPIAARTARLRHVAYNAEPPQTLMVAEPDVPYGTGDKKDGQ